MRQIAMYLIGAIMLFAGSVYGFEPATQSLMDSDTKRGG